MRAATALMLAAMAAFVVLFALAARAYPGGTWFNPATVGHRFWQNFLCDLEWETALNGLPNPGAALMRAAMLVLVAVALPLWWVLPVLFPRHVVLGRLVRGLGTFSVAAMIAVALVPSELSRRLHQISVVCAGVPALLAAILSTVALAKEERPPRIITVLGLATLALTVADLYLYVRQIVVPWTSSVAIPALQKVALIFALAWVTCIGTRVLLASRRGDANREWTS